MLESWTSVSATGRQLGASSLAVGLWLHCYQTTGTVSDLPHSWSSLNNDPAAAMVAHLWSRFLPATVTGGTIPGLRRISSGTVKPFASQPSLHAKRPAVHPHMLPNFTFSKWPHADRSSRGICPWQWRHFWFVSYSNNLHQLTETSAQISLTYGEKNKN